MPRPLKVSAFITFVLAVVFYLFFQISKHDLALSQVNVFAEDPYDAVGSFGVQFALFTALSVTLSRTWVRCWSRLSERRLASARSWSMTSGARKVRRIDDAIGSRILAGRPLATSAIRAQAPSTIRSPRLLLLSARATSASGG